MLTPSLEDYLEEMYRLEVEKSEIRVCDIAECLNVSQPSVVKALKKLKKLNMVSYKPYRPLKLTEMGKKRGKYLVDRNMLIKKFLQTIFSRCDIEQEAEAMEHYLSRHTIKAMQEFIEFMEHDKEAYDRYSCYIQEKITP
ncbi:MAG: iron dependent repressor, metal binding and dimerization domain protein [Clostridia bacterium]|nr:iron dependent repressor, metal binding and dimerization domain protein [Clostridia bacterium]